jgi:hypothetical protein
MYKVEVEDIEKKLKLARTASKTAVLPWIIFTALMVILYAWHASDDTFFIVLFSFLFIQGYILYYFISPILGKIELMEEDIKNLKSASNVEDERHY